ncbi:hypothetical protein GCM10027034_36480 [Ramlibacter solisilvae]|uniref:Uncharacterized protein n=1 Tax=Ramlibacter tataouinensis TaxID=94132 RepID=A0A127JUQ9_9BURK|nr:hypothetical protein [Ramlibacter tataouinensis]AMO23736.1 hypothetical protein UC35_13735 [Ramlibacter tataouinensis]
MPNTYDAYFDLGVRIPILVVTDGAIGLWDVPGEPPGDQRGFTLRQMARALWDPPAGAHPYTRFAIDHAIHGAGPLSRRERSERDPETGKTRAWTQYDDFQFDDPGFDLAAYSQVWFFGYGPGPTPSDGRGDVPPHRSSLNESELKILAAWMNAGGGVFATGGHGRQGASLCSELSRVRQMRCWFRPCQAEGSPAQPARIDTLAPVRQFGGQPEARGDDAGDGLPRRLRLKRYPLWDALVRQAAASDGGLTRTAPHPLLCSALGPINLLPDPVHGARLHEDAEVVLDASDPTGCPEFPGGLRRPKPETIAWATVARSDDAVNDAAFQDGASPSSRVVPVVAVYDGQRANVGRVVVDSSWHNWLDLHVRGASAGPPDAAWTGVSEPAADYQLHGLELSHCYFRNVAQWLASPFEREAMRDGLLAHLAANMGGWSELGGFRLLIGQRAMNLLGQLTSEYERDGIVFEPWLDEALAAVHHGPRALALPSKEFVASHVLGAMVQAVFELIPELLRIGEREDHDGEIDGRALPLLVERLRLARRQGLRDMVAEWRRSLDATARFLDSIDNAAASAPSVHPDAAAAQRCAP